MSLEESVEKLDEFLNKIDIKKLDKFSVNDVLDSVKKITDEDLALASESLQLWRDGEGSFEDRLNLFQEALPLSIRESIVKLYQLNKKIIEVIIEEKGSNPDSGEYKGVWEKKLKAENVQLDFNDAETINKLLYLHEHILDRLAINLPEQDLMREVYTSPYMFVNSLQQAISFDEIFISPEDNLKIEKITEKFKKVDEMAEQKTKEKLEESRKARNMDITDEERNTIESKKNKLQEEISSLLKESALLKKEIIGLKKNNIKEQNYKEIEKRVEIQERLHTVLNRRITIATQYYTSHQNVTDKVSSKRRDAVHSVLEALNDSSLDKQAKIQKIEEAINKIDQAKEQDKRMVKIIRQAKSALGIDEMRDNLVAMKSLLENPQLNSYQYIENEEKKIKNTENMNALKKTAKSAVVNTAKFTTVPGFAYFLAEQVNIFKKNSPQNKTNNNENKDTNKDTNKPRSPKSSR